MKNFHELKKAKGGRNKDNWGNKYFHKVSLLRWIYEVNRDTLFEFAVRTSHSLRGLKNTQDFLDKLHDSFLGQIWDFPT